MGYTCLVIRSFKHKGLAKFFETGSKAGIQFAHAERLRLILGRLNAVVKAEDMELQGLRLHPLKGERKRTWAVWVSGNWRVTFRFIGADAEVVDYEDYH
jgi:toxin HigB-1